ncbi:MAG: phosphoenolpyruvate-utilizing N-terminal domain-containing protein, partial [Parachlamydiales bacterium]
MAEKRLKGIRISRGIAFGSPFLLKPFPKPSKEVALKKNEVVLEIERYKCALNQSRHDLEYLQRRQSHEGKNVVTQILEAHLEILQDPLITEMIVERISKLQKNTETVFQQVLTEYQKNFEKNHFFEERLNDIQDVAGRILSHLSPRFKEDHNAIFQEAVVFAGELIPSLALELAQKKCAAFVTEKSGYTSHAAIIARAKGIPFVTGIRLADLEKLALKQIIVDGLKGEVIINPDSATVEHYTKVREHLMAAALKKAR